MSSALALRDSCSEPSNLSPGSLNRFGPMVSADVDAFGANEGHVGDTEEAEHIAQVCLLVIEERERRRRTGKAATRRGDDDFLAASEPFRSVLGVAEGLPGDRKPVDPRLELRRNAEVLHGRKATTMSATRNSLSAACPAARSLTPLLIGREGALKTGEMNSGQVVERQADLLQRGRKGTMPPGAAGDLLCRGPSGVPISAFLAQIPATCAGAWLVLDGRVVRELPLSVEGCRWPIQQDRLTRAVSTRAP